ncbi:MAG: hypothetical protein N3A38_12100 [Planctomycetota bacterium]|nr:hypothetical protein [Planctomycetota bacterium]
MRKAILTGLAIILAGGGGWSGEMTPEAILPVHEEQDAYTPCVAFARDVYLVAWQSGRLTPGDLREGFNFNASIVGCRVDRMGKVLDTKPFPIAGAASLGKLPGTVNLRQKPHAASNGEVILIVWQDLRNGKDWDVYAARVMPDGKVLDPDGVPVCGGPHNQALPRVAWDGKTFLVVWQDFRSNDHYDIYAGRVGADGKALDPQGFPISDGKKGINKIPPAVASSGDGKSYIFFPSLQHKGTDFMAEHHGHIVADGKAGPPSVFDGWIKERHYNHDKQTWPDRRATPLAMAAGARVYLLTWQNYIPYSRGRWSAGNIAIFDETGGKRTKALALGDFIAPEVCWDGSAFVVAWDQVQSAIKPDQGRFNAVYAARVSPEGEVVMAAQFVSGAMASPAHEAAVASDGAGTTLIAYEKHPEKSDVQVRIGCRILAAK